MCDMPCIHNDLHAANYMQWVTRDAIFHSIEIMFATPYLSDRMKADAVLSSMVKIINVKVRWSIYPPNVSESFSMLKLQLQAVVSNANIQSQVKRK